MATVVELPDDVPDFVIDWVTQLTNPDTLALLAANATRKIDLTLYAHRGRASRPAQAVITTGG